MIKNMTRKGLALGAIAALAGSALSAVPAVASETLSLAPSVGTSYNVLSTAEFTLNAGFAGTESDGAAKTLKYRITNAGEADVTGAVVPAGNNLLRYTYDTASTVAGATSSDFVLYSDDGDPELGSAANVTLSVVPDADDANILIGVQAWLDLNGNNRIDPGEPFSPVRTLGFWDQENVTGSVTFLPLTLNSAAVAANVVLTPEMNYQMLSTTVNGTDNRQVDVDFLVNGASNVQGKALWNAASSVYRATANLTGVVVSTNTYGAQLRINSEKSNAAGANMIDTGDAVFQGAAAGEVASLGAIAITASASVSNDAVRSGSGTFEAVVRATPVATKPKAGQTVTFTIAETGNATLAAGASITAGGKTLANTKSATTEDFEIDVLTDANGDAKLAISYVGLRDGNSFSVIASAVGAAGPSTDSPRTKTFTAEDSKAHSLVHDKVGGQYRVERGSALSIGYTLVDQFGQTPTGTFRAVVTKAGGTAVFSGVVPVSAGSATFSTIENSTSNADYTVTAAVQKQAANGSWAAISPAVEETTNVSAVTAATVAAVTANVAGATTATRDLLDAFTGNSAITLNSVAVPAYAAGTTVGGKVTAVGGAPMKGALVTLSSPNITFKSGTVYSHGSITVSADASGDYVVNVYSNIAGKQVVTVTAGAATATREITFSAATGRQGATVTITGANTVSPGSTLVLTGKIVDKYGNPVNTQLTDVAALEVAYTGPGLLVGDLPDRTNADGEFVVRVLLGSGDRGAATLTAVYGGPDGLINADPLNAQNLDNISAVKTVQVGDVVPGAGTVRGWTRFLSATDELKIYARDLVGQGKVQFMVNGNELAWIRATSAADPKINVATDGMVRSVFVSDMLVGRNVIEIYVDGVRIDRRIYTR